MSSKTYERFLKIISKDTYLLKMRLGETVFTLAKKGDNSYSDTEILGQSYTTILKDHIQYTIMKDQKTYTETPVPANPDAPAAPSVTDEFLGVDLDRTISFTAGETEIDGTVYMHEEYENDGERVKYCFDNDQLRYLVMTSKNGEENRLEFLEITNEVPDSFFEIPADYKKAP